MSINYLKRTYRKQMILFLWWTERAARDEDDRDPRIPARDGNRYEGLGLPLLRRCKRNAVNEDAF